MPDKKNIVEVMGSSDLAYADLLASMSEETEAWANRQLMIYGNVILKTLDTGEVVPGVDMKDVELRVKEESNDG